ncbi:hypothetical protein [Paenibacillus dendritiformis]|uniref:hypothetical protein n=1 Tax=Paenibacillus dendritiformis TaxID=130049 RepID=UPI001F3AF209|nr:hypothetical protein [Paenibacillus dendritiformis]
MKSVRAERKEGDGYTEMVHPFVILPEEQVPEGIEHCERCRVILGEGNPKAKILLQPSVLFAGTSLRVSRSALPITRLP